MLNDNNDPLLLLRHDGDREYPGGYWCLPGGKRDPDESPKEAAEREVFEETGLLVECEELLATRRGVSPRGRHFNLSIFLALLTSGQEMREFPTQEHQDFLWGKSNIPQGALFGDAMTWCIDHLLGWALRDMNR